MAYCKPFAWFLSEKCAEMIGYIGQYFCWQMFALFVVQRYTGAHL